MGNAANKEPAKFLFGGFSGAAGFLIFGTTGSRNRRFPSLSQAALVYYL